jgi:replicative DNA helicase
MIAAAENTVPQDTAAEQCAIASMMLCGDEKVLFNKIRRQLWPRAFYQSDNATLFRVLCRMADADKPIDSTTLRAELRAGGLLNDIGGTAYIATLLQSIPSASNGPQYARIVSDRARERAAIQAAEALRDRLMQPGGNALEAIQKAAGDLWKIATANRDVKVWKLGEAVDRFVEMRINGERKIALDTGVDCIDREYRGVLTMGGYTLIAARPSMGKSTLTRWLLTRLAKAGTPVGLIAVEENEDKIAGNVLSAETMIENSTLAYGSWQHINLASVGEAVQKISPIPFFGVDSAFTLNDILASAELLVVQHGCRVIALDHIHLVDHAKGAENREQQISEISNALKGLFKRLGVAGIVAAQLNRPAKESSPPPPHLTDLRGSGALEEHADAVLMIHRQDYYYRGRENYQPDGMAQIFIRKNRNGCVGEVALRADLSHQRFEEIVSENPFGFKPWRALACRPS